MQEQELITGFSENDSERIGQHLSKLLPHLIPNRFVIVGGLAIRHHLEQAGITYPQRPINDLDIIAEDVTVVKPDIIDDFLVYHFHQDSNLFYFAFVDEDTRTKVDVFDYSMPPEETVEVSFKGEPVKIVSVEDQLVKTVFDIQRISNEAKVDPKQFLDASLLMQIADMDKANKFWLKKKRPEDPGSITEAIKKAEAIKNAHPNWVTESPFKKTGPYKCKECVVSEKFPLGSMQRIYKILGMIE